MEFDIYKDAFFALQSKLVALADVLHKGGAIDPAAMIQHLATLSVTALVGPCACSSCLPKGKE